MARITRLLLLLALALSLAVCAAPSTTPAASGNLADNTPSETPRASPPMSSPTPPRLLKEPVALDTTCRSNADCAIKNVGNCCGAMPACVNKDSPTDPGAVQAQCNAKGMVGVCGFKEISACQCDSGQCTAVEDATTRAR